MATLQLRNRWTHHDKQSDIVQHVEQYDAIQIDNGDAHAIYNFINTHSSKDLTRWVSVHIYCLKINIREKLIL